MNRDNRNQTQKKKTRIIQYRAQSNHYKRNALFQNLI